MHKKYALLLPQTSEEVTQLDHSFMKTRKIDDAQGKNW